MHCLNNSLHATASDHPTLVLLSSRRQLQQKSDRVMSKSAYPPQPRQRPQPGLNANYLEQDDALDVSMGHDATHALAPSCLRLFCVLAHRACVVSEQHVRSASSVSFACHCGLESMPITPERRQETLICAFPFATHNIRYRCSSNGRCHTQTSERAETQIIYAV